MHIHAVDLGKPTPDDGVKFAGDDAMLGQKRLKRGQVALKQIQREVIGG